MKFLKRLFGQDSTKKANQTSEVNQTPVHIIFPSLYLVGDNLIDNRSIRTSEEYIAFFLGNGFDYMSINTNDKDQNIATPEVTSLFEKYPDIGSNEELYWLLERKEDDDEELTDEEKIFLADQGWANLGRSLYREHIYGRAWAIKELVNNNYQMNPDDGNTFKELINFTLNYFEQYFLEKPDEADELLIRSFPVMQPYIKRYIYKQQNYIPIENRLDEQEGYDEFLLFYKHERRRQFPLYPDQRICAEQVRKYFKISLNDMIGFLEREDSR